jgi:hypothetical protein
MTPYEAYSLRLQCQILAALTALTTNRDVMDQETRERMAETATGLAHEAWRTIAEVRGVLGQEFGPKGQAESKA